MSELEEGRSKADILIVDDTPANLRLLSKMLRDADYHVRPVPDGELALNAARSNSPDLILLDIKMPGLNGYQVCTRLKGDRSTRDIPVIFISALDEIQDKVEAFNVGGLDYITKPFQLEEVLARVRTHLELRELQIQLQEKNRRMEAELTLAGEVQRSFLPVGIPETPGWQISFELMPARKTSGDFYDVFRLPDERIGLITADVVDKGIGAALFMALCYGLLKTSIMDHPSQPEQVFSMVNQRILEYTTANQFLTIFYGILDIKSGQLVYCNAGHCPPLLCRNSGAGSVEELQKGGLPLGIYKNRTWSREFAVISPGDVLVVYTDGITEADNGKGEFYGEARLKETINNLKKFGSKGILDGVLAGVKDFSGDTPQYDDISIAVIKRDPVNN